MEDMIMNTVDNTNDMAEKNSAMEAAINNSQIAQLQALAKRYKDAHITKIREHKKIGRNDPCPCGSGKKFKNCCINKKDWNTLIPNRKD